MITVRIAAMILIASIMNLTVFAQSTSEKLYLLTKQMSETSPDLIWPGFDPMDFTAFQDGALRFSPDPGNPDSPVFMRLTDEYFGLHTLEENIAITVHEAFHGFERSPSRKGVKWGAENAFLVFEYEAASPRNNALFAVEAKLLKRALAVKDPETLRRTVSEFLTVRRMRQAELDPKFVEFEKGAELNEGLAEYAGTSAVLEAFRTGLVASQGLMFSSSDAASYMRTKYDFLDGINRIGSNVRRKFYFTGSAQAFLLDRLMPGKWKERVQMDGASTQDLLAEAVDGRSSILDSMGYESLLAIEEQAAVQRKKDNQELLRKTLSAEGTSLTIDFSALGGLVYIRQFDPMNVTMVEPDVRVHTRMVKFGKDDVFGASFDKPVVEDLSKRRYIAVADGRLKIVADGVAVDPSQPVETGFTKGLKISADGIEITAQKGMIVVADGSVTVIVENQ